MASNNDVIDNDVMIGKGSQLLHIFVQDKRNGCLGGGLNTGYCIVVQGKRNGCGLNTGYCLLFRPRGMGVALNTGHCIVVQAMRNGCGLNTGYCIVVEWVSGWWPKYRVLHCRSGLEEWVSGWWPKYVVVTGFCRIFAKEP